MNEILINVADEPFPNIARKTLEREIPQVKAMIEKLTSYSDVGDNCTCYIGLSRRSERFYQVNVIFDYLPAIEKGSFKVIDNFCFGLHHNTDDSVYQAIIDNRVSSWVDKAKRS